MMNKGKMKIGLNLSKLEIGKKTEAGQTASSSGFGSFGSTKKPEPEKSIENEVRADLEFNPKEMGNFSNGQMECGMCNLFASSGQR